MDNVINSSSEYTSYIDNTVRLNEFELSRIIEESLNEIYIYDAKTLLFVYVNHGARLNIGYSQEELLTMTPLNIKPIYTKNLFLNLVEPLLTGDKELIQFTTLHQRKDGTEYTAEINLQLSTLESRTVFVAIILDISKRVAAEKSLSQATNIINRSPAVSFLWQNKEGWPVEYVSDNTVHLFGYPASKFLNGDINYIHVIHPDDLQKVSNEVTQFSSKIDDKSFKHEPYRVITKEGEIKWVEDNTYIIRDEQGEVTHFEGIILDITERIEAVEKQSKLQTQMEHAQRLESLGVLAGGIAHDFNNILTAVMGNANLAELKLADNPEQVYKFLSNIITSSERAADLCKQMLAYSGRGKFEVKAINVSKVVEDTVRLLDVSINKGVALKYQLAENLPLVEADVSQIQQIIMNLVINASEAIGSENGVITINSSLMQVDKAYLMETSVDEYLSEGDYVSIEVSDTGCGMDANTQQKIFDPFFTTKFTGRGLGMSAVLGIIRGHKGIIKVCSELGQGTTFKVLLPISETQDLVEQEVNNRSIKDCYEGTVLVVDDEGAIREALSIMLEELGFKTLTAENGKVGVDIYRENQNDIVVVILDMSMPKMDGKTCFRELSLINKDVKVILSSGYNEQDDTSIFTEKGLAGFIQKPYSPTTLEEKISTILTRKSTLID